MASFAAHTYEDATAFAVCEPVQRPSFEPAAESTNVTSS
jgi:hypothetical protein